VLAIGAILDAREVGVVERQLGLSRSINVIIGMRPNHSESMPSAIRGLTVDEALDLIADRFKGAVLFAACRRTGLYDVGFDSRQ